MRPHLFFYKFISILSFLGCFFFVNCSSVEFSDLSKHKSSRSALRLTFQFEDKSSFPTALFLPVRFFWPNGKEEKIWKTSDVFTGRDLDRLKEWIGKSLEQGFGSADSNPNIGSHFGVLPLNLLIAEDQAIVGEFAFYFRSENGSICKERLSLFLKKDTSTEQLKRVFSKGVAYLSFYFVNGCLDPNSERPKLISVSSSFLEHPLDFLTNWIEGSSFAVEFLDSIELALEKLPREMKYEECVRYGNTSGKVRCIYSEQRTVRDIEWKSHFNPYPDFRWDWALPEKTKAGTSPF